MPCNLFSRFANMVSTYHLPVSQMRPCPPLMFMSHTSQRKKLSSSMSEERSDCAGRPGAPSSLPAVSKASAPCSHEAWSKVSSERAGRQCVCVCHDAQQRVTVVHAAQYTLKLIGCHHRKGARVRRVGMAAGESLRGRIARGQVEGEKGITCLRDVRAHEPERGVDGRMEEVGPQR